MVHVGKRIKEYRKKKGLTQKALAEQLNMTQQNIAYIEKCQSVSLDKIQAISRVLGVFPTVFLIDEGTSLILEDKTPLSIILYRIDRNLEALFGLVRLALENNEDKILLNSDNTYYEITFEALTDILNQSFNLYKFLITEKGSPKD